MPVPRTTTFLLVPWQDSARDIVTVFSSNGHSCAGAICPSGVPGFLAWSPVLLFVVALPFYVAGAFGRVCIAPVRWVYELRAACLRRSGPRTGDSGTKLRRVAVVLLLRRGRAGSRPYLPQGLDPGLGILNFLCGSLLFSPRGVVLLAPHPVLFGACLAPGLVRDGLFAAVLANPELIGLFAAVFSRPLGGIPYLLRQWLPSQCSQLGFGICLRKGPIELSCLRGKC